MAGPKHSLREKAIEWWLEMPYEELIKLAEGKELWDFTNKEIEALYIKANPKRYESKYREVTKRYNQ